MQVAAEGGNESVTARRLPGDPPPLFAEYAVLDRAWRDTQQILAKAVKLLEAALPDGKVRTIAVSGSLA